jgi:hypothetical protein
LKGNKGIQGTAGAKGDKGLSPAGPPGAKGPTGSTGSSSDLRFKENLRVIDSALEKTIKLRGVEFNWVKMQNLETIEIIGRRDIGVIAQEVNEYFPELVTMSERGYYMVRYDHLLPIIVESIQIQNQLLTESEKKLEVIEIKLKEKGLI